MQRLPGNVHRARQPITAAKFFEALQQVWRPANTGGEQKLGLAISGGVDSMALASLCHLVTKLPKEDRGNHDFKYYPLIVDHKAREGSTEEALLVSERLRDLLDVQPTILTLDWPDGVQPSDLSRFESEARRLRYQALGRACRLHGVESLLVAQHADDQVETILTRLASGHGALGLQGIRPSNDIPECWGIHGVHQSGKSQILECGGDNILNYTKRVHKFGLDMKPIPIESGGIVVYRPLLPFRKNELIATCQEYRVSWVEDESNKDPTRTVRNAVRKLISSEKLPRALRPRRLLVLAHRIQVQIDRRKQFALRLLHATHIETCDLRWGTLSIQVPIPPSNISWHNSTIHSLMERNVGHYEFEVSMALRRLIAIVSPLESISMASVKTATEIMTCGEQAPPAFTAAGVMFVRSKTMQPCDFAFKIWTQYNSKAESLNESVEAAFKTAPAYVWTLTRKPYHSQAPLPVIPLQQNGSTFGTPLHSPRSFHLWDGRFWIRVENLTGHPLCIRPLAQDDLEPFYNGVNIKLARKFWEILRSIPYRARLTLPAIALADDVVVVRKGESRVLALPSVGAMGKQWTGKLSWKLRYKHIDLDCHAIGKA